MEKIESTPGKMAENQTSGEIPSEIKSVKHGQNPDKSVAFEQKEKNLNSKILKITMKIQENYPELSRYLEEMPVTVPSENNPEITLNQLQSYYESLISLLKKYKVDHSKIED